MQTLDLTNKQVSIKECDSVPDVFVSGPVNAMRAGPLLIVTLTNIRPDINQLMSGHSSPDLSAVVVSRLVMPVNTAQQLVEVLGQIVKPAGATATPPG